MKKIASPIGDMKEAYDVVVVGSGYGGAISASRLSRAGFSVCVLERGKERVPGEYPESALSALPEFQVDGAEGHVGFQTAMFDFRLNSDVSVLVGCGLGGTSLINANVALRPDKRVFTDGKWPAAIANDLHTLDDGFELAEAMLGSRPYPESFPTLPKMEANATSARALGVPLLRPPLNVTFEDGTSSGGVEQKACSLCGNCVTGCNHLAKNTTLMNYLPDAHNHGAKIFCEVKARWVERQGDEWVVHCESGFWDATRTVRAKLVILAAGSLGSTEILLRSRQQGLAVSDTVGQHFSGNGDMLAFAYNPDPSCNGIGWEGETPPPGPPVGPTITSAIDLRGRSSVYEDVLIEEGAIPSALAAFASDALFAIEKVKSWWTQSPDPTKGRSVREAGAATQTYLVMSLDDDEGQIVLEDDRARVVWPNAGREPDLRLGNKDAKRAAEAIGGAYEIDPLWSRIMGRRLITVHPIGGCVMADDAARGVVDDMCRVFDGPSGAGVYDGLMVCDGSVIPSPLGVNPLLTISAVTERACHYLCQRLLAPSKRTST
ncbi:MAG TPA: GMC family oxidoreductase N-terminal domain-containing protein [Kofleriaceae bacterium]|nr:GMC family oxidoreductase N-terminal domain-containing protein [Kofleriaceae bacterium]